MSEWEQIKAELREWIRNLPSHKVMRRENKQYRVLARQIARAEHHIRARPLLNNGRCPR